MSDREGRPSVGKRKRRDYRAMYRAFDEDGGPDDEQYQIGIVLLAGVIGRSTSISKLARATGLGWDVVSDTLDKFRARGLLQGETWRISNWADEETGGIAFCCDVAIAQGYLTRAK